MDLSHPPEWLMSGLMGLGVLLAGTVLKYVHGIAKDVRGVIKEQGEGKLSFEQLRTSFDEHRQEDRTYQQATTQAITTAATSIAVMNETMREVQRRLNAPARRGNGNGRGSGK
jgi:hypothetical protein